MSGLAVLPPLPELAAELVAAGTLAASGAASMWQAAVLAFRAVTEGARKVREKQYYEREFTAIVRDDRELRALARDTRGIAVNRGWADGNPGPVTRLARWLTGAALLPADGVRAMAVNVRDAVARRRKGGSK